MRVADPPPGGRVHQVHVPRDELRERGLRSGRAKLAEQALILVSAHPLNYVRGGGKADVECRARAIC